MDPEKKHVEGYKLYLFTFITLSILTLVSVWITQFRFSARWIVGLILVIATLQASVVLMYNMHLKFHDKILRVFVWVVSTLLFFLIVTTMFDYIYR